jgi:hypothetical protein
MEAQPGGQGKEKASFFRDSSVQHPVGQPLPLFFLFFTLQLSQRGHHPPPSRHPLSLTPQHPLLASVRPYHLYLCSARPRSQVRDRPQALLGRAVAQPWCPQEGRGSPKPTSIADITADF